MHSWAQYIILCACPSIVYRGKTFHWMSLTSLIVSVNDIRTQHHISIPPDTQKKMQTIWANHLSCRLGRSAKPNTIKLNTTSDIIPLLFFRCHSGQLLMSGPWYPCQWYSVWTGLLHRIHSVIWLWFWLQTQPRRAASMWKEPLVEPPFTYMWR